MALYGEFHFESTPMAPPGTKALIHKNSGKRCSWAYHAIYARYVGPEMVQYLCYTVITAENSGERTAKSSDEGSEPNGQGAAPSSLALCSTAYVLLHCLA